MKRTLLAGAAAVGVATLLWADPLSAASENAPHEHDASHPHHVLNASGCHDIQAPDMGGSPRGTHRAAINNGASTNDGMHHGTCEGHDH